MNERMNGEAADPVKSPLPVGCSSEFQARKDPCSKKLKKKQHNGKSHGPQPTSLYMPRSSRGSDVANSHLQGDPHGLAGSRTDRNLWLVTSKMVTTTSAWPSFQTEVRNWLPPLDGPKQTLRDWRGAGKERFLVSTLVPTSVGTWGLGLPHWNPPEPMRDSAELLPAACSSHSCPCAPIPSLPAH